VVVLRFLLFRANIVGIGVVDFVGVNSVSIGNCRFIALSGVIVKDLDTDLSVHASVLKFQ